ncbi:MAG TPA: ABC transporter permease [Streptosporangiaceae bacterium]
MNTGTAVGMVARREIATRMRSKAYLIVTGIMIVSILGLIIAVKVVGGSSAGKLGVLDGSLGVPLRSAAAAVGVHVTVRTVPDRAAGERQVRSGELDALVVGRPPEVVVKKNLPDDLRNVLNVLARQQALDEQIIKAGGDPAAVERAVAGASVHVRALVPGGAFRGERIAVGVVAGILVYLALMIYGQTVAQGVVEEKASRIVEILLTAIRPWQLMLGKVVGIGVTGLTQMFLVASVGVTAALLSGTMHIPASLLTGAAAWGIVWFLLGFLVYALLFAAMGSLVSRQEDAGSVVGPVMILIIVPYVLGISILPADPENGLLRVLSLIPLFAPTLMPMRVALGVPAWELGTALGLTVLLAMALVGLAGRIYSNAVLRMGSRIRLSDAWRAA